MTHPQQTTREVIEQLVDALNHCMDAITERGLNGSPDQAEKWGLQLPLERAYAAIAAGQQALEQTRGEAPNYVWSASNRTATLLFWNEADARKAASQSAATGLDVGRIPVFGAHPQATEPAPSTAGEWVWDATDQMFVFQHKVAMNWFHVRRITPHAAAALLQSTADHIAEQRKLVAAMPVVQLTHPTADMQIAGGAVELDYTGVQTAPNTVGWLTAARVWLAMERASTQPKRLTFEALNAAREAHQNKRTDDYFEAQPQIDNTDRRRVFENGYKRGFDDGMVFQRDQGAA